MKNEDNIERFFQKHLKSQEAADDGWNMPSDELWEQALPHFPKEKKRRKFALWYWLGSGLLFAALVYITIAYGNISERSIHDKKPINDQQLTVNLEENNSLVTRTETKIKLGAAEAELIKAKSNTSKTIGRTSATTTQYSAIKSKLQIEKTNESILPPSRDNINIKSKTRAVEYKISSNTVRQELDSQGADDEKNLDQITMAQPAEISTLKTNRLSIDFPNVGIITPSFAKTQTKRGWEIGISQSLFYKFPKAIFLSDPLNVDSYEYKLTYENINLPISYRFGRRSSLSTGIYWSRLGAEYDFVYNEIYQSQSAVELELIIREKVSSGSISLNDDTQELNLSFFPNITLQDGDDLTITGKLPLALNIIQVPILYNYHINLHQWEVLLSAGISIDRIRVSIPDFDIKVYRENQLISQPIEFDKLQEIMFGLSAYSSMGIKYNLSNRFNIGLSSQLNLLSPSLSRFEMGLHYRL